MEKRELSNTVGGHKNKTTNDPEILLLDIYLEKTIIDTHFNVHPIFTVSLFTTFRT